MSERLRIAKAEPHHTQRLFLSARWLVIVTLLGVTGTARAQFAVIDVASVTQLIQEVQTLAQQLAMLRAQLAQAQTLYQSMTGQRGMQQLLDAGAPANYLPTSWSQLIDTMQGQSVGFPELSQQIGQAVAANAVLSPAQLGQLAASSQSLLDSQRETVGLAEGLSDQALVRSSARFADLQQLGTAIGATEDQKSILELQATLAAEQGTLQNDQTKLQVLFQAAQAQRWALAERERELIVAGHGRFASRFEPSPM